MEAEDGCCNTRLGLGLGYGDYVPRPKMQKDKPVVCLDLSFTLCPKEEEAMDSSIQHDDDNKEERLCFKSSSVIEDDEEYSHKRSCHAIDSNKDGAGTGRKKVLRLTKEQSALLEESFKLHTTLNPAQKQALAEQLNLKQRQIEVWFQNRRARTKLKQTEIDCEFLRKCCENLSDENRRLKIELHELRSLRTGRSSPFHFSKDAKITTCPSCEKRSKAGQKM